MITFASFGSDSSYEMLSYEILRNLSIVYPNSFYKVYSRSHLPDWINSYARKYPRGYGYWTWKPYLVHDLLSDLSDGDILLYVDGRCGMPDESKQIMWFNKFIESPHIDICAWQMNYIEQHWCSMDLISALGAKDNTAILESGQFAAGIFALRVSNKTRKLLRQWLGMVQHFSNLCRDEPSIEPNHSSFKENRHDQSVFSIILKTTILRNLITPLIIPDSIIYSDNLRPHMKTHP